MQRNYLIHNLYGSFVDEIEKSLLPVDDLVEMDVEVYTEKTQQTAEDFNIYASIVLSAIKKHNKCSQQVAANAAPLL